MRHPASLLAQGANMTPPHENITSIPLKNSEHVAIVLTQDLNLVEGRRWVYSGGYAGFYSNGNFTKMEWMIIAPPAGFMIDHANRKKLDNRRGNLRIATSSQNQANRTMSNGRRFKGVHLLPSGKYRAVIGFKGTWVHGGTFSTEEEAALKYDQMARHHFGEFAATNFPYVEVKYCSTCTI